MGIKLYYLHDIKLRESLKGENRNSLLVIRIAQKAAQQVASYLELIKIFYDDVVVAPGYHHETITLRN